MLPTEKNTPGMNPLNKKTLLYAEPKVGKSTLISKLFPDAIFIATDPTGLEELPVFRVDCRSWEQFRSIGKEIMELRGKEGFPYEAICVDTIDELSRFCAEYVLGQLPGGPAGKGYRHASDWEYGKAWNAISEEFRLRVASLCRLGLPVVFVSHAKQKTKRNRTGLEITVESPDVGSGGLRDWLLKFVDYIFYAEVVQTDEGEARLLRTLPSETYLAGGRQPEGRALLPDPLPLDGARLRAALEATAGLPSGQPEPRRDISPLAQAEMEEEPPAKPAKKAKPKPAKQKAAA
jgi:hypothetical protein